jgi:hypothetical protein
VSSLVKSEIVLAVDRKIQEIITSPAINYTGWGTDSAEEEAAGSTT